MFNAFKFIKSISSHHINKESNPINNDAQHNSQQSGNKGNISIFVPPNSKDAI